MSLDMNPIIDRLCETFPAVFNRQTPKPLKIGVGEELMAMAGEHPAFAAWTRTQMRRAIKGYTRSFRYRKVLATGGARYDLAGQPAGEVTPEQQALAQTPRKQTAGPPSSPAPSPAAPALSPAERQALFKEVMAMAIPGKLDVTLGSFAQRPEKEHSNKVAKTSCHSHRF
ncbi:MAG: ProQ/FinO family protein [Gammaproteobacteria bacterium]|nr:ProQ/FinO family protein [Gammaproteobacteria bacterium]